MFKAGLPFFIYFVNSVAGWIYVQKFLKEKYQKKITMFIWMSLYFIAQSFILEKLNSTYSAGDFVKTIVDTALILLLQILLYNKDLLKQLFVAVSFVAGKEIIKYIIVVLNYGQYWVCNKFLIVFSNEITTLEKVKIWNFISDEIVCFISLFLYALLVVSYFSIISRKFIKKDYQFRIHEYAFLILPSAATLCISITLKIMIISVENGIAITIFEKVPETMFWIPLICFLLLGVVIVSIILFQKLVQCNEEERKRVILENQMIQMQREVEEIQDIYADMRGLKHDMKSHLESITAVIKRTSGNDYKELDNYIGKMKATVSRLDFMYKTGNPITDVIIHQKKQETEKRNIIFEVDFVYPNKQQIDVYDIGIVLNNALENAIEASSKLEGKKNIYLRSYMKGNLFFIEVENDFADEIIMDSETGLPISNKDNKQLHGIGIENIQRCAKKYMGDIDITISNANNRKKFNLTIMMYEKYFTPKIS